MVGPAEENCAQEVVTQGQGLSVKEHQPLHAGEKPCPRPYHYQSRPRQCR